MLQDMFGEESVPRTFSGDKFEVTVDAKTAKIDLVSLTANCEEDSMFEQIVQTALSKLHHSLVPVGESWWNKDMKVYEQVCTQFSNKTFSDQFQNLWGQLPSHRGIRVIWDSCHSVKD